MCICLPIYRRTGAFFETVWKCNVLFHLFAIWLRGRQSVASSGWLGLHQTRLETHLLFHRNANLFQGDNMLRVKWDASPIQAHSPGVGSACRGGSSLPKMHSVLPAHTHLLSPAHHLISVLPSHLYLFFSTSDRSQHLLFQDRFGLPHTASLLLTLPHPSKVMMMMILMKIIKNQKKQLSQIKLNGNNNLSL